MKYVIDLLQKQWNENADKAEYMICGTPELDAILEQNEEISNAIKILNGNILDRSESFLPFDCPHCGESFTELIDTEGHRCVLRRNDTERS